MEKYETGRNTSTTHENQALPSASFNSLVTRSILLNFYKIVIFLCKPTICQLLTQIHILHIGHYKLYLDSGMRKLTSCTECEVITHCNYKGVYVQGRMTAGDFDEI
jgi:hypothetical protein